MGESLTGRDRLCQTGHVTDTRHWEPRPQEPRLGAWPTALTVAEIAAATGERPPCPSWVSVAGAALDLLPVDGREGWLPVSPQWNAAREPTVGSTGEGLWGGRTVGAKAPGNLRWAGEEVR
jgi:hypothetical protein